MAKRVVSNVLKLVSQKQIRDGRIINVATIARDTGLNRLTVNAWVKNDLSRFDSDTIIALCRYFECDIGDLLSIVDD